MQGIVNAVRVADRLYEMRDTARSLYGDTYEGRIAWAKDALTGHAAENDGNILSSCLEIMQVCEEHDAVMSMMQLGAAAVELVEGAP
jgi:hypothetical protein